MLTQEQKERIRQLFEAVANKLYVIRENVTVQNKRCTIVFVAPPKKGGYFRGRYYPPTSEEIVGGISEETYNENKDEIERIRKEVEEQDRKLRIRISWITLALADRLVVHAGSSWETGLQYYELVSHVPDHVWKEVGRFFTKVQAGGDLEHPVSGWVIIGKSDAEKVKEILKELAKKEATEEHIKAAQEYKEEEEKARIREARQREIKEQMKQIVEKLETIFRERGEKPAGSWRVDGEIVDNPIFPPTIYGTGEWYVIQAEYIWYCINHGMDGDDWSLNNVVTGGAGAIGFRIPYDESVAKLIRELKMLTEQKKKL